MEKLKSSSEDPNETILKVLSGIWQVVWFVIKWLFIISFTVAAFILALAGLRLPNLPDSNPRRRPGKSDHDIDPEREWEEVKEKTTEEIFKEIKNIEPSTSEESTILQKLKNSRGKRLKDISLSKKEWMILLILLLRARGKISS